MPSVNKQSDCVLLVKVLTHAYCGQQANIILLYISYFLLFQLFIASIGVTIVTSEVPVNVNSIAEGD